MTNTEAPRRTIRLLDTSGLFWPIWRKKEAMGEPVGAAAADTVQALRERAESNGADYVVACCDTGRSFRWDIAEEYRAMLPDYAGYKGHRADKDPAMMAALDRVIAEIEADGVPIFRAPGFEADDVIATLTHWAVDNGLDVEIATNDKDLMQLVCDPVADGAPAVRVVTREGVVFGPAEVFAKFGVPPQRLGAYLALVGDVSDGIKGVPGIGEETAAALLWGHTDKAGAFQRSPFNSFASATEAAIADQAQVESNECEIARARENKQVRALAKQGVADDEIAAKIGITTDSVAAHRGNPIERLPQFPKPRFKDSTRKALISGEQWFDISFRLATLRTDVPLDFAAVTAPRAPKSRPNKTPWRAIAPAAAEPETLLVIEEEDPMQETTTPQSVDERIPPLPSPAPEVTGEPVAPPQASAALTVPTRQIVKFTPEQFRLALEPQTYEMARTVAEDMYDSGLFAVQRVQAALAIIQVGRAHGLSAVTSLMEIHMIEGKPQMSAKLLVALVRRSGKADYLKLVEAGPTGAKWKTHRKDDPDPDPVFGSFTIEEARRALLGGVAVKERGTITIADEFKADSNWSKYPEDMCVWRAAARLIRREYSDVIGGLYAAEEMDEYAPTQPYSAAA